MVRMDAYCKIMNTIVGGLVSQKDKKESQRRLSRLQTHITLDVSKADDLKRLLPKIDRCLLDVMDIKKRIDIYHLKLKLSSDEDYKKFTTTRIQRGSLIVSEFLTLLFDKPSMDWLFNAHK